jgi:flagellar hook assembly protein FlgD
MPNGLTISNSGSASILFKSIAGFSNADTTAHTFNIDVRTSSDTTVATGNYTLSATQDLTVNSVTPNPTTQNANASYSVRFTPGTGGGLSAGNNIQMVFPSNSGFPVGMEATDVTINGDALVLDPTIVGNTLTVRTPYALNELEEVTVLINQIAGILNPTTAQGYTLDVSTTAESGPFTSPTYNITQTSTTVSAATVTPDPVTPGPGTQAKYTIDFNTGTNGRLVAGTSTITVTFNANTSVSTTATDYDSTFLVVDGVKTLVTGVSVNGQAVTLTVPTTVSITNNESVTVLFDSTITTAPIGNPTTTGDYTLTVRTSVEISNITSNTYTITTASAVTNISATLGDNTVNAESAYTIQFDVQIAIGTGGTITITFPSNTLIPASIATSAVDVDHGGSLPNNPLAASAVSTNSSTRTVIVTVPEDILATETVSVDFALTAGIENPSIDQDYTLNVRTSSQNINGTSVPPYALVSSGATIQNLSVNITPLTPSVDGRYEFNFNTSMYGRLVSGVSQIFLLFPVEVALPGTPPSTTRVRVNGTAADALELAANTLIVTVPSSVTIGNMTAITVVIDEEAGIQTASTTASLNYQAYTSVDDAAGDDFSLPVELTSFAVESSEGAVYLSWTTESELENAYWMIQRATLSEREYEDIQQGDVKFEDLGSQFDIIAHVDGKGSIAIETNYTYIDSLVEANTVYAYRLADVSYSGVITIHEIVYQKVDAPLIFKLYKNYPNPFNPSTTIKYSLPIDAQVELKVFNILGQEVITLVDDVNKAGFHDIQWHGKNQVGNSIASGMYFVYFNAKGVGSGKHFNQVMKVIFLK